MKQNHTKSQIKLNAVLIHYDATLEEAIHHVKDEAVLIDLDGRLLNILANVGNPAHPVLSKSCFLVTV